MSAVTRGDFTRAEIVAANEAAAAEADARDQVQDTFRRQEIVEMNADADGAWLAKWGLIGLGVVFVLGLMMQPPRSKR